MFEEIAIQTIFATFLIFCRVGGIVMFLPGFGEGFIPPATRLSAALLISLVMLPIIEPTIKKIPDSVIELFLLIFYESFIGLFIGLICRIIHGALHTAGTIISFQTGLASALIADADQGGQATIVGNFITITGLTALFASNLHHVILMGIDDSYKLFPVGDIPIINDLTSFLVDIVAGAFLMGVKISSPLIVIGLLLYLASGLMARLMPSMQVFFVIIPVQIYLGLFILAITIIAGIAHYLDFFNDSLKELFKF